MTRLYAATGDGIAQFEESGEDWTVELSLPGSGAQCLAVDPNDPHHLRWPARGWRATNARRRPKLARLRPAGARCLLPRGERRRRGDLCGHRAEPPVPHRRPWRELARARRAARAALAAELELPAAAVDIARALDRAQPSRCQPAPGRDRARRLDALERRWRELAGSPSRRAAG